MAKFQLTNFSVLAGVYHADGRITTVDCHVRSQDLSLEIINVLREQVEDSEAAAQSGPTADEILAEYDPHDDVMGG